MGSSILKIGISARAPALRRVKPSPNPCEAEGSGVVIAVKRAALVLTAAHVADIRFYSQHKSPQEINEEWRFTLWDPAGRQYDGAFVAAVPYFPPDLALLRINGDKAQSLIPVPLADAADLPPARIRVMGFRRQAFSLSENGLPFRSVNGKQLFGDITMGGRIDQPYGLSGGPFMADDKLWGILSSSISGAKPEDNYVAGPSYRAIRNMFACWLTGSFLFTGLTHPKGAQLSLPADVTEILRGAV